MHIRAHISTETHTHTHTHSLTHSLTHSHTHTHSLSHTHTQDATHNLEATAGDGLINRAEFTGARDHVLDKLAQKQFPDEKGAARGHRRREQHDDDACDATPLLLSSWCTL